MSKPIVIVFHCLFELDGKLLPSAMQIVVEQMEQVKCSGLEDAASEIIIGINGGDESVAFHELFPAKATIVHHGLACRNELRTLLILEEWVKSHPDWYVLYFHSKGACHPPGDPMRARWRGCMMRNLISNWQQCVKDLDDGYEAAGCHYMKPPATPPSQYIFGGNFFWVRSSFLQKIPSIMLRDRLKISGIDSLESRFEAEVWIGNGPRPPKVRDYHPNWDPGKVHTCNP